MADQEHWPLDLQALSRLPNIFPYIACRDAVAMIQWLETHFGFEPHAIYPDGEGGITHAELRLGAGLVFVVSAAQGESTGQARVFTALAPDQLSAHHDRAVAEGAQIVESLAETDFGTEQYEARDPEGNRWVFGTYHPLATDLLDPADDH